MALFAPKSIHHLKKMYLELLPRCAAVNYDFSLDEGLKRKVDDFFDELRKAMAENTKGIRKIIDSPTFSGKDQERLKEIRRDQKLLANWLDDFTDKKMSSVRSAR